MEDLIEALQILAKYAKPEWPTICSHDLLTIAEINAADVSEDDKIRLDELGFFVNDEYDCFQSHRFGSA